MPRDDRPPLGTEITWNTTRRNEWRQARRVSCTYPGPPYWPLPSTEWRINTAADRTRWAGWSLNCLPHNSALHPKVDCYVYLPRQLQVPWLLASEASAGTTTPPPTTPISKLDFLEPIQLARATTRAVYNRENIELCLTSIRHHVIVTLATS